MGVKSGEIRPILTANNARAAEREGELHLVNLVRPPPPPSPPPPQIVLPAFSSLALSDPPPSPSYLLRTDGRRVQGTEPEVTDDDLPPIL